MTRKLRDASRARLAIGAVVALAAVVGVSAALAAIPDGSGMIHGCYSPNGATAQNGTALNIIDSVQASCSKGQQPISWGQTGPQGPQGIQGPQGASVTSSGLTQSTGPCSTNVGGNYGSSFTVSGNTTYACTGPQGPQGTPGGSGTSHVYFARNNNDVEIGTDPGKEVVGLSGLPTGAYMISSTLHSTYASGQTDGSDVYCSLLKNGNKDTPLFDFPTDGTLTPFFQGSTISTVASISSSDTIDLYCFTADLPTEVVANLTALAVNEVN